jgi:hypothetical protein
MVVSGGEVDGYTVLDLSRGGLTKHHKLITLL